jgi:hypothetical protein
MQQGMEQTDRYREFLTQNPPTRNPNFPEFQAALEPQCQRSGAVSDWTDDGRFCGVNDPQKVLDV